MHMIQMFLDTEALLRAADKHLVRRSSSESDYILHTQLCELFGAEFAPKPFAVVGRPGRQTELLGYADEPADKLHALAQAKARPLTYQAVDWEAFASKPMPSQYTAGSRFNFRLRSCPVTRKARGSDTRRAGAEVDVFLAAVERVGSGTTLNRNQVYTEWIQGEMTRVGGAQCTNVTVNAFGMSQLLRRDAKRDPVQISRPDVVFEGALEVIEPEDFGRIMRRGVGRHRSFGFGMLLLR